MIIDLSHTLTPNTPVFPGDTPLTLTPCGNSELGILDHRINTGMHIGTHMDGPRHMLPTGKFLHEFPVEKFRGRGRLIDCRDTKLIDMEVIAKANLQKNDVVLFYTGLSEIYTEPQYFTDYPVLTAPCAERLAEIGVSLIGLDFCSPDRAPYTIHRILLNKEILIIENLTGLKSLEGKGDFEVLALPLKTATDSAPVRVVAIL